MRKRCEHPEWLHHIGEAIERVCPNGEVEITDRQMAAIVEMRDAAKVTPPLLIEFASLAMMIYALHARKETDSVVDTGQTIEVLAAVWETGRREGYRQGVEEWIVANDKPKRGRKRG